METIKLKSAEEYLKELFEEPFELEDNNSIESDFYNIIKNAQKDAIEKTIEEVNVVQKLKFYQGESGYLDKESREILKETIFKDNNL